MESPNAKESCRVKNGEPSQDVEIVDGKTKGKYTLRKAQPIDRYRPYGKLSLLINNKCERHANMCE